MDLVRMSLADAGRHLGLSVNGTRTRWKKGLLKGERDNTGKVWVWLDPDTVPRPKPAVQPSLQASHEGEVVALREHIVTLRGELVQTRAERDALAVRAAAADRLAGEVAGLVALGEEVGRDRDQWRNQAVQLLAAASPPAPARRGWWLWRRDVDSS